MIKRVATWDNVDASGISREAARTGSKQDPTGSTAATSIPADLVAAPRRRAASICSSRTHASLRPPKQEAADLRCGCTTSRHGRCP